MNTFENIKKTAQTHLLLPHQKTIDTIVVVKQKGINLNEKETKRQIFLFILILIFLKDLFGFL